MYTSKSTHVSDDNKPVFYVLKRQ